MNFINLILSEWQNIQFAWPWVVWLAPLPLVLLLLPRAAGEQHGALTIPFWYRIYQLQKQSGLASIQGINVWRLLWLSILWGLLLLACARPIHIGEPLALPREGRNLMVAVDISGSMRHQDMVFQGHRVDRLSAVKGVLKDFLKRREGDRVGLILFGSQAFIQTPLTFDIKTVQQFLDETVIGWAGEKTAIGDAIGLTIKHLEKSEGEQILVLLSDGESNAGNVNPNKAASFAAEKGLKIYTIAFGRDPFGNPYRSQTLNHIAQLTGGQAFTADRTEQLEQIYKTIESLEPIDGEQAFYRPKTEKYFEVLKFALLWFIMGLILNRTLIYFSDSRLQKTIRQHD